MASFTLHKRISDKVSLLLLAFLAFCSYNGTHAQQIRYAPSLETSIESIIEIGIEHTGRQEVVLKTTRKQTIGDRREFNNVLKDIKVNSIEESRTKATNPNKLKTKPKPSGLFGGIARAFGGDYSGLAEWGLGFADHMMEPKYIVDVKKVYLTKDYNETTTTQTFHSTWNNQTEFETTVQQTYSADINKGFMKFSVAVRNIGERSVRIKIPEFVIHFVNPGGDLVLIDKIRPEDSRDLPISIAPLQSRTFTVFLKNLNFITLSQQYRNAVGVRVTMQDLFIDDGNTQLKSVGEILEDLADTHVRVDYFDGSNRSVRFFPVAAGGMRVDSMLEYILADKSHQLNPHVDEQGKIDNLILRIGSRSSDTRTFSSLENYEDQYNWHHWFITISDNESTYFDAKRNDKVYPGYSIRLGYYSAEQVLPPDLYKPVIYQKDNVTIKPNQPIPIPMDLLPGDLIVFEHVKLLNQKANLIRFKTTPKTARQVMEAEPGRGAYPLFPGNSYSAAQLIMRYGTLTPSNFNMQPGNYYYLLEPEEISQLDIRPSDLVKYNGIGNEDLDEDAKHLFSWLSTLNLMKNSFTHIEGSYKLNFPTMPYGAIHTTGTSLDQVLATMGMIIQSGEDLNDYLERRLIQKEQLLTFVVEEPVSAMDSKWVFASPPYKLRPAYIQTSQANLPATIYGLMIGNSGQFLPTLVNNTSPGLGMMPMTTGYGMGYSGMGYPGMEQDPDRMVYNLIATKNQPRAANFNEPYILNKLSYANAWTIPNNTGPELSATVKVIRYRGM